MRERERVGFYLLICYPVSKMFNDSHYVEMDDIYMLPSPQTVLWKPKQMFRTRKLDWERQQFGFELIG